MREILKKGNTGWHNRKYTDKEMVKIINDRIFRQNLDDLIRFDLVLKMQRTYHRYTKGLNSRSKNY